MKGTKTNTDSWKHKQKKLQMHKKTYNLQNIIYTKHISFVSTVNANEKRPEDSVSVDNWWLMIDK